MLSTKNKISRFVLFISALLLSFPALYMRPTPHFAYVSLTNPDQVQIDFLWQADISAKACENKLNFLDELTLAACPNCQVKTQTCLASINPTQKKLLSSDLVDFPTMRLSNGAVAYQSSNPDLALKACQDAQSFQVEYPNQLNCTPSQTLRPLTLSNNHAFWVNLIETVILLLSTALTSWFACYLILRHLNLHENFSLDTTNSGIQKLHANPTPRIGGVALFASLLTTLVIEMTYNSSIFSHTLSLSYFILACIPVFLGGLIEDVTKNVGVTQRLMFSIVSGLLVICLLGAIINRIDIAALDNLLILASLAVFVTTIGLAGLSNAFNIIDGFNGLSAGYAAIAFSAIAFVAFQVNDHLVLTLSLGFVGGLFGFLCWNWPHGKIFMGDGGAYLVGFSLAELAILLIYRNSGVSPWFTAIIVAYPIAETLFSMLRRKFILKTNPGQPDNQHFHQLVFYKILRGHHETDPKEITRANSRVAIFTLLPALLISLVAIKYWQSTAILMPLTLAGCVLFVAIYYKLLTMPK